MNIFFWIYFIPALLVALLAIFMPVRRFEKWPRIAIGVAAPISVINSVMFNNAPGDLGDVPISLCLDMMVIYIAHGMLRMRNNAVVFVIILTSIVSILFTLMRLNTDAQIIVVNFMEIAAIINAIFIIQLCLVAFLSFEYILVRKGWFGTKPVNYFKNARENKERAEGTHNNGSSHQTTWRKFEHRNRRRP